MGNEKIYVYLSNNDLMTYSLNHNLLISHSYFHLPFDNDFEVASFDKYNTSEATNYKYDYKILTIPSNFSNSNLYVFADTTISTHIDKLSMKQIVEDTVFLCIGSSNSTTLDVGNVSNQRVYWDNEMYNNLPTRNVTLPGEYWAIVTHDDSCNVKKHLFIVSDSNIVISGHHNTCDTVSSYSIVNPIVNQTYQWAITPSSSGTIIENNNTSIVVRWHSNNMSDSIPSFLNVINNCGDTIDFKIWRCCSKAPFLFDTTITSDFPIGDLYLNGTIIINTDINLTNANFYMGQEAKIVVNPPYTFSFKNSSIESGCNHMWDGIYLSSPESSVVIQNAVHVKDAYNAIVSENGASVFVTNTIFYQNLKGIVVKNHNGGNVISISKCKFLSTVDEAGTMPSNLKPPYSDRRGMTGIEICNVANAQVGGTGIAYRNLFSNLDYGIDICKSNVNIYNNTFINMTEIEEFTGIGIRIEGNISTQQTVNIGGYNIGNTIYSNLFNNCNYGVKSLGSVNLNILSDTVTDGCMGFVIDNNNARNIIISKNKIFLTRLGQGIYMSSVGSSRVFVDSNYVSATSLNNYAGIGVENVMPQIVNGVTIRNNKIVGSFRNGIILTNILKPTILNPNATERSIPYLYKDTILLSNLMIYMPYIYSAISVSGCTNTVLEENVINKIDGFTTTTETRALRVNGINISTSTSNHLCDNKITDMGIGIRYQSNCKTATNYQNILNHNYYGFRFDNAAIGHQGHSIPALSKHLVYDNQWINNYVLNGRAQGSLSETTKWYYRLGTNFTLKNYQFNITYSNLSTYQITPNQSLSCGYDGSVAIGGGSGGSTNSINDNYENENYIINIEENRYYDFVSAYRIYGSLAIENDDLLNSTIISEINPMNIPLFAKAAEQAAEGLIDMAFTTNCNITPINLIEKNQQIVNQIYLNSWAQGRFNLTDDEYYTLLDIASQEYVNGGYGVFGAEVMTQRFENHLSSKNQFNYRQINLPDSNNNEIILYPNPAKELIFIYSNQKLDNAKVELFSVNGTLVYDCYIVSNSEGMYLLNISTLKSGIYFCIVRTLEGKQFSTKLIVY